MPSNFDAGPSSIAVYVYSGKEDFERVGIECDCLLKVENLDWIKFDRAENTLKIETSNSLYVGYHKIIAIKQFQEYVGVYPFTEFSLQITS